MEVFKTKSVLQSKFDPAFPRLDASEIAAAAHLGRTEGAAAGAILYQTGDSLVDFYLVVTGAIDIFDRSGLTEHLVTQLGPGEFTGEVGLLAGRPALMDARASVDSEVVRLNAGQLRQLLVVHPCFGEKWISAIIRRRISLLAGEFEGLHVFGRAEDAGTLRVTEFFYRNGVPHRWRDLALDEARAELARFHPEGEPALPVVRLGSLTPLYAPSLEDLGRFTGVLHPIPAGRFDVVIVGAGPAGLGAAVYAASEVFALWCSIRWGRAARQGVARELKTTLDFRKEFPGAISRSGPTYKR